MTWFAVVTYDGSLKGEYKICPSGKYPFIVLEFPSRQALRNAKRKLKTRTVKDLADFIFWCINGSVTDNIGLSWEQIEKFLGHPKDKFTQAKDFPQIKQALVNDLYRLTLDVRKSPRGLQFFLANDTFLPDAVFEKYLKVFG